VKESYVIVNNAGGSVSFSIYPPQDADNLQRMSGHHRRKMIRSSTQHVSIQHGTSIDFVERTGLSVKDLKNNPELYKLINSGKLLRLVEETPVVKEPVVEETPVVKEPVVEEPVVEETPVVKEPVVEEKKTKKPSKKKSKKK